VVLGEEPIGRLGQHAEVPISFVVDRVLDVTMLEGGLGGLVLAERVIEVPWVKDYDAIKGEGPGRGCSARSRRGRMIVAVAPSRSRRRTSMSRRAASTNGWAAHLAPSIASRTPIFSTRYSSPGSKSSDGIPSRLHRRSHRCTRGEPYVSPEGAEPRRGRAERRRRECRARGCRGDHAVHRRLQHAQHRDVRTGRFPSQRRRGPTGRGRPREVASLKPDRLDVTNAGVGRAGWSPDLCPPRHRPSSSRRRHGPTARARRCRGRRG